MAVRGAAAVCAGHRVRAPPVKKEYSRQFVYMYVYICSSKVDEM